MKRLCSFLIFIALAGPSFALDQVQMLGADGQIRREMFGAPSPTPAYCYWNSPTDALTYHATNADGYGNDGCPDPWLAHCDSDSLVFRGAWPLLDNQFLLSSGYLVDLACSVTLTAEVQLSASRSVTGVLDTSQHTLVVEFADGTDLILLDDASGPDQAQVVLPPGTYQLHLHVDAYKHVPTGVIIEPYAGEVVAHWSEPDPLAAQPSTWSSVKALYLH